MTMKEALGIVHRTAYLVKIDQASILIKVNPTLKPTESTFNKVMLGCITGLLTLSSKLTTSRLQSLWPWHQWQ